MADKKQRQKLASVDQDLRMETELEADPMLTLSEGRASKLQIAGVGLTVIAIIAIVAWGISQP